MCDLTGRVALVTGAASGIGAATAITFARAGADVALGWYPGDPHDVEIVRREVEATGRRALVLELDVASTDSVDAFVAAALNALGRIDIVVANAGIARTVPCPRAHRRGLEQGRRREPARRLALLPGGLPHLLAAGYGRLLATSSVAGTRQSWTEHVHYTAAKAGIVGLVTSLAIEVGRHGVTVNAVAPGVIESPQSLDPVNSLGVEGVAAAGRANPVGRVGKPEDVAALYRFLASADAGFINGQLITVDGGRTLVIQD